MGRKRQQHRTSKVKQDGQHSMHNDVIRDDKVPSNEHNERLQHRLNVDTFNIQITQQYGKLMSKDGTKNT